MDTPLDLGVLLSDPARKEPRPPGEPKRLRQKLEQVEEYRRLLEKYPHAKIGNPVAVTNR